MTSTRVEIFRQGMIAGMLGSAAVVLFFVLVNVIDGRPFFHTAGVLGSALFYGARTVSEVSSAAGPVLAFNGLHMIVCLGFGLLAAWLTRLSERGEPFLYVAMILYVMFAFHMFGALLGMTEPLRASIPVWALFVSGLLCSGVIALYLLRIHPEARHALHAPIRESY